MILGINTPGKYTCKCNPDFYEKEPDGKTCKRLDNIDPWILFSNKYYIRNMSADARDMSLIQQELRNVVSLDYHYENQNLYFADVTAKTIFKAKIGHIPNCKSCLFCDFKESLNNPYSLNNTC